MVGLQVDPAVVKDVRLCHAYGQRFRRLSLIKAVDRIIPYRSVEELVGALTFDHLFLGEDQLHAGFVGAVHRCHQRGIRVTRIARTPGISSSSLRQGQPGRFTCVGPPLL